MKLFQVELSFSLLFFWLLPPFAKRICSKQPKQPWKWYQSSTSLRLLDKWTSRTSSSPTSQPNATLGARDLWRYCSRVSHRCRRESSASAPQPRSRPRSLWIGEMKGVRLRILGGVSGHLRRMRKSGGAGWMLRWLRDLPPWWRRSSESTWWLTGGSPFMRERERDVVVKCNAA